MRGIVEFLGVALLLLIGTVSAQEAPGDEDGTCMNRVDAYPSNIKMLMSSWHYLDLIGNGGVWDVEDFDTNNSPNRFYYTNWIHSIGGTCRRNVKACGSRRGRQDNWLFTQFINKTVPSNTQHTVKVIANISYTITACRERFGCNPQISVLSFVTTGRHPREMYSDKTNYKLIAHATGMTTRVTTIMAEVEIPVSAGGFYLAVQDNSSCIQISKTQVFCYQCVKKQEGLVIFPETAAPVENTMTVMAQCMPNSSPIESLAVTCSSKGQWEGSSRCRCNAGYYRTTSANGVDSCQPCRAGTYRNSSDPENTCLACPANTERDEEAVGACECLPGYFRNTEGLTDSCPRDQSFEYASFDCTQPPSMPLNVVKTESSVSSLDICWSAPSSLGGRSDLYYRVHYSDPDNVGVMLEADCGVGCLTDTCCTISGLRAATRYLVRVSSHNGVSDQNEDQAAGRMKSITLQTDIPPPSAPQNPRAFCEVVVWGSPKATNGDILHYVVKIGSDEHTVPPESTSFVFPRTLSSGTAIEISAVNSAGKGPIATTTVPSGCGTSSFIVTPICPPCANPAPCPEPTTVTPSTVTSTVFVPTTVTNTVCATPTPSPPSVTAPGSVEEIVVLGPCSLAWKPPLDDGGERPGYAVRFFDGASYSESSYRAIFRHFDDPDRLFASNEDCPTDKPIYADVRAGNSAGTAYFSDPVKVFDPADQASCAACDSCCEVTEKSPVAPTLPACASFERTPPGEITGLVKVNCTSFKWDVATTEGCTDIGLSYRIRLFSGSSYSGSSQKTVLSSNTNSLTFTAAQVPFTPVNAVVKARRGNGVFSTEWSSVMAVRGSTC